MTPEELQKIVGKKELCGYQRDHEICMCCDGSLCRTAEGKSNPATVFTVRRENSSAPFRVHGYCKRCFSETKHRTETVIYGRTEYKDLHQVLFGE